MEGGPVKTILEIVSELCQQLYAILMEGGLVKTIFELAGLHWRM